MWSKLNKVAIAIFVVLFTAFGIQLSYADYYPSGIQQDVPEQTLIDNGWTLFYEETYGTAIGGTATPLIPSGQYVILAGKAVGSSNILLAAAAPTAQVFTETVLNTPQLLNGTYWYNTSEISFGFAPTAIINQDYADVEDISNPLRLSLHIRSNDENTWAGWRLGAINFANDGTNLEDNDGDGAAYLKQVWTWNGASTAPAPAPEPAPAPAPAPANVRQSSNLTFAQSLYASDTLSDPDGQLRSTVDQIMNKYGSLVK